jgi:hypothetical protein
MFTGGLHIRWCREFGQRFNRHHVLNTTGPGCGCELPGDPPITPCRAGVAQRPGRREFRRQAAVPILISRVRPAAAVRFTRVSRENNHPSQWLNDNGWAEEESGKWSRLREIAEVVAAKQEKMLLVYRDNCLAFPSRPGLMKSNIDHRSPRWFSTGVPVRAIRALARSALAVLVWRAAGFLMVFTQFREMTGPLASFLGQIFGRPGLVLHGDSAVKSRKTLVRTFQEDETIPFFVLSLKAGGSGLTLTAGLACRACRSLVESGGREIKRPTARSGLGRRKTCWYTNLFAAARWKRRSMP